MNDTCTVATNRIKRIISTAKSIYLRPETSSGLEFFGVHARDGVDGAVRADDGGRRLFSGVDIRRVHARGAPSRVHACPQRAQNVIQRVIVIITVSLEKRRIFAHGAFEERSGGGHRARTF